MVLIVLLFSVHKWVLIPVFNISNAVPVIYQHLLLGGMSLIIYLVTNFVAKNFFNIVGFVVLGFLLLKMIFIAIFINKYALELDIQPQIKHILLAFYFVYLIFLLVKIVPLVNIDMPKKES